jgi:hypothetical protein
MPKNLEANREPVHVSLASPASRSPWSGTTIKVVDPEHFKYMKSLIVSIV